MLSKMLLRKSAGTPTLSFNTSSTSTSHTITIPAGAEVGDIAVLFDYAGSNITVPTSTVVPSGWTSVSNQSSSTTAGTRAIVSYKKLVSGDPGASITGMDGNLFDLQQILVFSPSSPIATITVAGLAETIADTAPAEQSVAAQTLNYVVIGCASTRLQLPSWTAAWYDDTLNQTRKTFGYKLFNSSPASVSMDFTASSYSHACIQAFALVVT